MKRDERPAALLSMIRRNDEDDWVPMNSIELDIVSHAGIIRDFIKTHHIRAITASVGKSNWSMGMEILRFMGHVHSRDDIAYSIITMAGNYDNDMQMGVLDKVYQKSMSAPVAWALPSIVNVADDGHNDDKSEGIIINPQGFKL